MIISMTGFGRGETSSKGISVTVELKSVNSRYLDVSLRLPQGLQEKELELKELLQEQINRGKLNVNVRIDKMDTGEPEVTINKSLVKGYKKLLEEIRQAAGIEAPVTVRNLIQFNEIFISREQKKETINKMWELTCTAADEALSQLVAMRIQEGEQLKRDLLKRVDHIDQMINKIKTLTDDRAFEARDKLLERIQNIISDEKINPERLELEVAILVDKMDITEEIVRLQSHIKFFKEAVNNEDAMGRRLNFLTQEMNREINTIGSKANNSEISQYVVHAKESLEQIREQVQNVE